MGLAVGLGDSTSRVQFSPLYAHLPQRRYFHNALADAAIYLAMRGNFLSNDRSLIGACADAILRWRLPDCVAIWRVARHIHG